MQDIGIYGSIEVKSSNNTKDIIDKVKGIKTSKGFLIDGYPRQVDQGIEFEKQVFLYFKLKGFLSINLIGF
jgi:hypothetical protein